MTRWTIIALACALAVASTQAKAASPRDEIEAALATFVEAFNKGDAAVVAGHYAMDGALLPPDAARVDGRGNIQKFWKGAIDAGLKDLSLRAIEVQGSGDLAFEVGELSYSAPDKGGGRATASGKYIVVWKKEADGVWRLYRDMWNADPVKPAP